MNEMILKDLCRRTQKEWPSRYLEVEKADDGSCAIHARHANSPYELYMTALIQDGVIVVAFKRKGLWKQTEVDLANPKMIEEFSMAVAEIFGTVPRLQTVDC